MSKLVAHQVFLLHDGGAISLSRPDFIDILLAFDCLECGTTVYYCLLFFDGMIVLVVLFLGPILLLPLLICLLYSFLFGDHVKTQLTIVSLASENNILHSRIV